MQSYLDSALKQFRYYKQLGDKTITQLSNEQLFTEPFTGINSIAVIIQHLSGNMLSRWTDFLNSDGEKEWRDRDAEFETTIQERQALTEAWENGWNCLFQALAALKPEDLEKTIYIRNMGQTVIDAINRQLCHYSYHVGQIVYIGKWLTGDGWQNLSIPRGQSQQYNQDKFSQPRQIKHFTEDYLNKNK
jgi:hypothetical protein